MTVPATREIVAVDEDPPAEAVTVTVWEADMADVLAVKEAVAAPAGTVTEDGVDSEAELLEIVTATPPEGAAADSVIVQEAFAFAPNVVAPHCSPVTLGATVNATDVVAEVPFKEAVMVAV